MSQQEKLDQLEALGKIANRAAAVVEAKASRGDTLGAIDDLEALLEAYNERFGEPDDTAEAPAVTEQFSAVVVYGNPVDGFAYVGPFELYGDAQNYADDEVDDDYWIAPLEPAVSSRPAEQVAYLPGDGPGSLADKYMVLCNLFEQFNDDPTVPPTGELIPLTSPQARAYANAVFDLLGVSMYEEGS